MTELILQVEIMTEHINYEWRRVPAHYLAIGSPLHGQKEILDTRPDPSFPSVYKIDKQCMSRLG